MVSEIRARRGLCLRHGGGAGHLSAPAGPPPPSRLCGRAVQDTACARALAAGPQGRTGGPPGLRISTPWTPQPVHDDGALSGLAHGEGDQPSQTPGLRRHPPGTGGCALSGGRPHHAGLRQPPYPQAQCVVRPLRPRHGGPHSPETKVGTHAQARQLAERGRNREQHLDPAVSAAAHPGHRHTGQGNGGLVPAPQPMRVSGTMALHHCRRSDQTAQTVPNYVSRFLH